MIFHLRIDVTKSPFVNNKAEEWTAVLREIARRLDRFEPPTQIVTDKFGKPIAQSWVERI